MIRKLTGTVAELGVGWVVVEVGGIGYLVYCPSTAHFSPGELTIMHTYLAVRENALDLYGFSEKAELEMFELLLNIPKIGPRSALQILSQASPTLLSEAAQKNDHVYLHKLSGLGKKTCENVVQYLSGKLESLPKSVGQGSDSLSDIQTDVIDALISLGYDQSAAREATKHLSTEDASVNSLLTLALKRIR